MYLKHCDIIRHPNGTAVVRGPCTVTGKEYTTPPLPIPAVEAYMAGRGYAQDLFPMLTDPEREFLISGTSPEGWEINKAITEPED